MEGISAIRIIRQVEIISVKGFNQPNIASPLIPQQQRELTFAPERKLSCINIFVLLVYYFLGIGSVVLGGIHLNDCLAEKMLPKGLVIFGGILIVRRLLNCVSDYRSICGEDRFNDHNSCFHLLNSLLCLAEFGMFIAVSYYAFSINPDTDPIFYDMKNYCNYVLYKTSFYGCIILWTACGLTILCGCCMLCVLNS